MKTTIIGIAGGTASGKTTLAKRIYDATIEFGTVSVIRLDDYYKKQDNLTFEERTKINYDHPSSYDSDLLVQHLKQLKAGNPIEKPNYDFTIHNRSYETTRVEPSNVIIVEGIMIFAIPQLLKMFDIKIFVETDDDIRFIRRLKRDTRDRGRTIDSVVEQYLTTVRPMHLAFVEPSKKNADIIIPEGGKNDIAIDFITTKVVDILGHSK